MSEILQSIKLNSLLSEDQRKDLMQLIYKYSCIISNEPGCTDLAEHDRIKKLNNRRIKSRKTDIRKTLVDVCQTNRDFKTEVGKMIKLKVIELGESYFTSLLILVEVPGKETRPCIDYRRLNKTTRTQYFPFPDIEHIVKKVSSARYITVLDLTIDIRTRSKKTSRNKNPSHKGLP
ncbi:uncharacterized protein LOC118183738 [Stegodyphus dumicola]|uniref:uncharacterized protein LOC118183738 n=1 Tax=Stegodyphus dumicola TaxID=202533 RepID=UPI0015AD8775|nr:uncharacterized protein LOC118183738 [Stegodyphus dumicola]